MKKNLLLNRSYQFLAGLLIALALTAFLPEMTKAQPNIPVLSLTGQAMGYNANLYPNGRIYLPPSNNEDREFLLPVYIQNLWQFNPARPCFVPDPIYSFKFTILYDETAVQAVGVENGKFTNLGTKVKIDYDYEPLATDFTIAWDDKKDYSYVYNCPGNPHNGELTSYYTMQLDPCYSFDWTERGRAITITGTSTKPLPNTDVFKVLLYVRFKIVPNVNSVSTAISSPIMIDDREIRYNDWNARKDNPFADLEKIGCDPTPWIPNDEPNNYAALGGIYNKTYTGDWQTEEPTLPGVIWLVITDKIPMFDFVCERAGFPAQLTNVNNQNVEWILNDPLTVDENKTSCYGNGKYAGRGKRIIQIINSTSRNYTRLLDVQIESDQPWLRFRRVQTMNYQANGDIYTVSGASTITTNSEKDWTAKTWIDNSLLGPNGKVDPNNNLQPKSADVFLEIIADPNYLTDGDEKGGEYVGYLTFKSHTAQYPEVRMRVTFIYYKDPVDKKSNGTDSKEGIRLNLSTTTATGTPQDCDIVFGIAPRASERVDALYGEYAYTTGPTEGTFNARFYPYDDPQNPASQFGFGDYIPMSDFPTSVSRDIRSSVNVYESHLYYVKMNRGLTFLNDIVITWNINDIPKDAFLFMKSDIEGSHFIVNMRTGGAPVPGQPNLRTFTIENSQIEEFFIEYTPAAVMEYVDDVGEPIIKRGWNLLSLPVRPTDLNYRVTYPNALTVPYFRQGTNFYPSENLKVGHGFFMKYDITLDHIFGGSLLLKINKDVDEVLLYPESGQEDGWNLIGGLSNTISINDLNFSLWNGTEIPDLSYVLKAGVWGYKANQGYYEVSEIRPGLGYWINVNQHGYLNITCPIPGQGRITSNEYVNPKEDIYANSTLIKISDNSQSEGKVYFTNSKNVDLTSFVLPPLPPSFLFDVRFDNNRYLENADESTILLQGVEYPLLLTIDKPNADYTFVDAITGSTLGSITKGSKGTIQIAKTAGDQIKVLRSNVTENGFSVTLSNNPIETESRVYYSINEPAYVTVMLYDLMGNVVANLAEGDAQAGDYSALIDATNLVNGSYILKIVAGEYSQTINVRVIK
jgi:hypothetical protein